jgi:hypothetical protein
MAGLDPTIITAVAASTPTKRRNALQEAAEPATEPVMMGRSSRPMTDAVVS